MKYKGTNLIALWTYLFSSAHFEN